MRACTKPEGHDVAYAIPHPRELHYVASLCRSVGLRYWSSKCICRKSCLNLRPEVFGVNCACTVGRSSCPPRSVSWVRATETERKNISAYVGGVAPTTTGQLGYTGRTVGTYRNDRSRSLPRSPPSGPAQIMHALEWTECIRGTVLAGLSLGQQTLHRSMGANRHCIGSQTVQQRTLHCCSRSYPPPWRETAPTTQIHGPRRRFQVLMAKDCDPSKQSCDANRIQDLR